MISLPIKLPFINIGSRLEKSMTLPINYTYSVNSHCDSSCKTCGLWKNRKSDELSAQAWKSIIKSIDKSAFWVTITGGNQFLRKDLYKIYSYSAEYNNPRYINIPVHSMDFDMFRQNIDRIIRFKSSSWLNLNISIDGNEGLNDFIRGRQGSFQNSLRIIRYLEPYRKGRISVGSHTTISSLNAGHLDETIAMLSGLNLDNYSFSIAEKREELGNQDMTFELNDEEILKILDKLRHSKLPAKPRLRAFMRRKVYANMEKRLRGYSTNCFAGYASIQISPKGDIQLCPMNSKKLVNLSEFEYDFRKAFFSKQFGSERKRVRKIGCSCLNVNSMHSDYICSIK